MTVSKHSYLARSLPLTLVAGIVALVSVQAACSDPEIGDPSSSSSSSSSSGAASQPGSGCRAGEREVSVAGEQFCCAAGEGDSSTCVGSAGPRAGDTCESGDGAASASALGITTDQCVSETCAGDLETVSYASETARTDTSLTCTDGTWQAGAVVRSQRVLRVCDPHDVLTCDGGYGYGYGYYGGRTATRRAVSVFESTCKEGTGAEQPCPAGTL
jgi:hypothetical protein